MIRVSEHFYSVQGEGVSAGVPAYFIRLPLCSLMCGGVGGIKVSKGEATWHCDSEAIWRDSFVVDTEELIKIWEELNIFQEILKGNVHIVFTGGEPLMKLNVEYIRQFLDSLAEYCKKEWYEYDVNKLFIEVETNGTHVIPNGIPFKQINCSPKLANSGNRKEARIKPEALKDLISKNAWFKFVVSNEDDIKEMINDFVKPFDIPTDKIILMPSMTTRDEFFESSKFVFEAAKKYVFRSMPRLHVAAWDKVTGV
jgi:organic radical activating enzyme